MPQSEPGNDTIHVSVVYALAAQQVIVELTVSRATTVASAVEQSGLIRRFPEIATRPLHCAIYSRVVNTTELLAEGDRVEILRPLLIDPKENRRQAAARAAAQKRR